MEIRIDTVVWYKGRIVAYRHFFDEEGQRFTLISTEGYASKLRELTFSVTIAAGQTIKQAVTTILDTYVTPNTRIRYNTADVVGAYVLVGTLVFKNSTVIEAISKLAMLQGSTEWGVTEGGFIPAFYFIAESSAVDNDLAFILGDDQKLTVEGEFRGAINEVNVVGGISSAVAITGTAQDATAQTSYGERLLRVSWAALNNATDANRYATNLVNFFKDGNGRFSACKMGPTARLEPDRTNSGIGTGSPVVVASEKAIFYGDTAQTTVLWSSIEYDYQQHCPTRLQSCIKAGVWDNDITSLVTNIEDRVSDLQSFVEQLASSGGAPTDATYLTLSNHAGLSQERAVVLGVALTSTDGGANGSLTVNVVVDATSLVLAQQVYGG